GGVPLVSESVPDRHAGIASKDLDPLLIESSILDPVEHAPEHAGGVFHRLFVPDQGFIRSNIGNVRSLIVCADLKSRSSTRRSLLEDQRNVATNQLLHLGSGVLGGPQSFGKIDQIGELLFGEV